MKPIEFPQQTAVLAKDQPEYLPLPVHVVNEPEGRVISCWELTPAERCEIFKSGRIWLQQMAFGGPLQPQLPSVASPFEPAAEVEPKVVRFKYYKRRAYWFGLPMWEVVYTVTGDPLVRPVSGLPRFWRWYNAEGAVLALVWAREMGQHCALNYPEP